MELEQIYNFLSKLNIRPFLRGNTYFVCWSSENQMVISRGSTEEQAILHFHELYQQLINPS